MLAKTGWLMTDAEPHFPESMLDDWVLKECNRGCQHCHVCPKLECCDNTNYQKQAHTYKAELQEARRLLRRWYACEVSMSLPDETRAFLGVDDADPR